MHSNSVPTIRISLDWMSQSIQTHIGAAGSDLGEAIERELRTQIEAFDFKFEVQRAVRDAICEALARFFRHGGAGCYAIEDSVDAALKPVIEELQHGKGQGTTADSA